MSDGTTDLSTYLNPAGSVSATDPTPYAALMLMVTVTSPRPPERDWG